MLDQNRRFDLFPVKGKGLGADSVIDGRAAAPSAVEFVPITLLGGGQLGESSRQPLRHVFLFLLAQLTTSKQYRLHRFLHEYEYHR